MEIKLEELNPEFRQITDLLLFSENTDLNEKQYLKLFKSNYNSNLQYFYDKFIYSSNIFWVDGFNLWCFKLKFILSLQDKGVSNKVCSFLEKRMLNLSKRKSQISSNHDVEFIQYLALCQVKKERGESLDFAKKFLEELPAHFKIEKVINVVNNFIPIIYSDIKEYSDNLIKKLSFSSKIFLMIKALEQNGVPYSKDWFVNLANSIIVERVNSDKNRRLFFELINDSEILDGLKEKYSSLHKAKLISLINQCDFSLLEDKHLKNIKNLISLDSSILDNIIEVYINKLYSRKYSHMRANADRLIKLINNISQISPRIILSHLSSKNQIRDIKYILPHFPEIKNLTIFL